MVHNEPLNELLNQVAETTMDAGTGAGKNLIELERFIEDPVKRKIYTMIKRPLEKLLSLDSINHVYRGSQEYRAQNTCYDAWLAFLNIRIDYDESDLAKIPVNGPLLVIANHPFGGLDGIALAALLHRVRSDFKLLGNYFLQSIPEMSEAIISVDPFHRKSAVPRNCKALREALSWLRQGNTLGMFPAGEVSHLTFRKAHIADPPWTLHLASLILHGGADVLPVYFDGHNSPLFHFAGLLHPRLRTIMLPRELINKKETCVTIRIGNTVPYNNIARLSNKDTIVEYLRFITYIQKHRNGPKKILPRMMLSPPAKRVVHTPIPGPARPELLTDEINRIPDDQKIIAQGDYDIYCARAESIPVVLGEIARLREQTFREIGEGTGKAVDRDCFDEHYLHLFMWNRASQEVVGAYRIGQTDDILRTFGARGLYTSTLFKFKNELIERLNPALELGRSFICSHYQKKYNSLALLWRGIGGFIARNPRYCTLFGPVSISNSYHPVSKNLLISFLMSTRRNPVISQYLIPRNPVKSGTFNSVDQLIFSAPCFTLDEVSALISEIEHDRKGVPVLLRHYLNLNGTILSFNLDKRFSRVIDGLMLVDLRTTDPRLLRRFLGVNGYEEFTRYHRVRCISPPSGSS
jgi:putative hemolysin